VVPGAALGYPRASIEDRPATRWNAERLEHIEGELRKRKAGTPEPTTATAAGGCGIDRKEVSPVKGVKSAEAVIDNGEFGVRKIRF
jgi:hypothetical protein